MSTLTKKGDWDKNYASSSEIRELKFGWRYRMNDLLAKRIEAIGLEGKHVLEIGAGDSQWLPYLAKKYPHSRFAGLDYSEAGCERLAERAKAISGAKSVEIFNRNMFDTDTALHGKFDLVMSFGVVEHFTDLSDALLAKGKFLKDQGLMFSLIPNMSGSIGFMAKRYKPEVFDMHNPHDWNSFQEGHRKAGRSIVSGGYLGSMSYGVLSSCFSENNSFSWHAYIFLTRLSLAVWYGESKLGEFPTSKLFSPYIYAISRAD